MYYLSQTCTRMHSHTGWVCLTVTVKGQRETRRQNSGQKFQRVKLCLQHVGHCSDIALTFCQMFYVRFPGSPCS